MASSLPHRGARRLALFCATIMAPLAALGAVVDVEDRSTLDAFARFGYFGTLFQEFQERWTAGTQFVAFAPTTLSRTYQSTAPNGATWAATQTHFVDTDVAEVNGSARLAMTVRGDGSFSYVCQFPAWNCTSAALGGNAPNGVTGRLVFRVTEPSRLTLTTQLRGRAIGPGPGQTVGFSVATGTPEQPGTVITYRQLSATTNETAESWSYGPVSVPAGLYTFAGDVGLLNVATWDAVAFSDYTLSGSAVLEVTPASAQSAAQSFVVPLSPWALATLALALLVIGARASRRASRS